MQAAHGVILVSALCKRTSPNARLHENTAVPESDLSESAPPVESASFGYLRASPSRYCELLRQKHHAAFTVRSEVQIGFCAVGPQRSFSAACRAVCSPTIIGARDVPPLPGAGKFGAAEAH